MKIASHPFRVFLPPAALLAGGFVLAFVLCAAVAGAQSLRLSDVLTTRTMEAEPKSSTLKLSDFSTTSTTTLATTPVHLEADPKVELASIENDVIVMPDRAERRVRELLANLSEENPLRTEALGVLMLAIDMQGRGTEAAEAATNYLARTPDGSSAIPAHRILAREAGLAANWKDAADHYSELIKDPENIGLSGTNALEAFLRAGRTADARRVLDTVLTTDSPSRTYWLLEILLVEDDAATAIPDAVADTSPMALGIELRRALLMDARGQKAEARTLYDELSWERVRLTDSESYVLDARLAAVATPAAP